MNRLRAAACAALLACLLSGCGSDAPPTPHPASAADDISKLDDAAQWTVSHAKVMAGECVAARAEHGGQNPTGPAHNCKTDPRANTPVGQMTMVDGVYHFDFVDGGGTTITAPDAAQVCVVMTTHWDGEDSYVVNGGCKPVPVTPPGTPLSPPAGALTLK